ncbi:MAG: hypothetical protein QOG87_2991 [Actinomycetota bacterium]
MASTTRTITAMGMSLAAARGSVQLHAVTPIANAAGTSWKFRKNDGTTRRPKDPGDTAG